MTKSTNNVSRVLCALVLCASLMFAGCTKVPEQKASTSITFCKETATTATITGHLNVAASDLPFSRVTVYYSDDEDIDWKTAESISTTLFDEDQNFNFTLSNLKSGTKYNYCLVTEVKSVKIYGNVLNFTTEEIILDCELVDVKSRSANIRCSILGLSEEDKQFIKVFATCYNLSHIDIVDITDKSEDDLFSILLDGLTPYSMYEFCMCVKGQGDYFYTHPKKTLNFRTLLEYTIPVEPDPTI